MKKLIKYKEVRALLLVNLSKSLNAIRRSVPISCEVSRVVDPIFESHLLAATVAQNIPFAESTGDAQRGRDVSRVSSTFPSSVGRNGRARKGK